MAPNSLRSSLPALLLVGMIALSGCLGAVAPGDSGTDATEPTTDAPTAEPDDGDATDDATDETDADATDDSDDAEASGPSDEELTDTLHERMSAVESLEMTQRTTVVLDGEETETATKVWARTDTGEMRSETLEPEARAGDVTLINESMMATYDADEGTVTKYDGNGLADAGTRMTIVGTLQRADVEYEATERIDGDRTYRVTLVPNGSMAAQTEVTAWLDDETYFPKRVETTTSGGELNTTTAIDYENVRLNPEIPDSRFTFENLPDDVEWEEYETPDTTTYDSREALAEAANFSVPAPDVPAGYEFDTAQLVEGTDDQVTLTYTDGEGQLMVTKMDAAHGSTGASGENVTVGDHDGRYSDIGDTGMVTWTCDGSTYSVYGPLDEEELIDVAETMECH